MVNNIKSFIFNNKIINILAQPKLITKFILVIVPLIYLVLYWDLKTFFYITYIMGFFNYFYVKIEKNYL